MDFAEVYSYQAVHANNSRLLKIDLDSLSRTLQEISFPDLGGGIGFNWSTTNVSRFITWRSHGETLELHELSTISTKADFTLTVQFPGSAIVDCRAVKSSSYLEFFVCTSNGCARISYWCNDDYENGSCSILRRDPDWFHFYQIRGLQPNLIQSATSSFCMSTSDVFFVYGLSTGAILVTRTRFGVDENIETFELHHTSRFQKLFHGITPFSKVDSDSLSASVQFTSLTCEDIEELVASICKDHRLRLWDLKRRQCFLTLDLLEFLPEQCGFESIDSLRSTLSPGLYHRIRRYKPHSTSSHSSSVGIVVYLALSRSFSLGEAELIGGATAYSTAYWYWLLLDITKARARDRDCLQVVSVEPVGKPDNLESPLSSVDGCVRSNDLDVSEVNVLDFLPICVDKIQLYTRRRRFRSRNYDGESQLGDHASASKLQGIWWLAHQSVSQRATLLDRYSLQWSNATNFQGANGVVSSTCALSPGLHPVDPLPHWRCQPPWLLQANDQLPSDLSDSGVRPAAEDVDEFVDFMFQSCRLSWFAISNALKSLSGANHLATIGNIVPSFNMDELRSQVHQALMDELIINPTSNDPVSLLKTFYSTAMDYHEYGLQPLGLFEIPFPSSLLQADSDTYIPCTPGLVVVRRFGFSILRPMDPHERLLWNTSEIPSLSATTTLRSMPMTDAASINSQLASRIRLLLRHLHQHASWGRWDSALGGLCSSPSNNLSDQCDAGKLALSILEELDERSTILEPTLFSDPTNWKQFVFTGGSDSVDYLLAFDKLISLLESPSNYSTFDHDTYRPTATSDSADGQSSESLSFSEIDLNLADKHKSCHLSPLHVELLCQGFSQSCETRLEFAFGLLLLATHHMLNSIGCGSVSTCEVNISFTSIICRLTRLVHILRLLRWLSRVRMPPVSDSKKLASITEQLSILGFNHTSENVKFSTGLTNYSTSSPTAHVAGLTLLEQLCIDFPLSQFTSPGEDKTRGLGTCLPWMFQFVTLAGFLHTEFTPSTCSGKGLLRVLRHLLSAGHASELLTLGSLLCLSVPSDSPDVLQDSPQDFPEFQHTGWVGDLSALYLCMGLAHLWMGRPEAAEDYFIRASTWLKDYLKSLRDAQAEDIEFPSGKPQHVTLSNLILASLFPGEFNTSALFGLRDLEDASIDDICPEEIQVRFLLKIMPVLESVDCTEQVLNLSELALNVLANLHKHTESGACSSDPKHTTESRRLTTVLSNNFDPLPGHGGGFLCDPTYDEEMLDGSTSRSQLHARLAELETVLWTRMFKHRLAAGHYSLAHQLVRSNPNKTRRRDCLRQLIVTLCDRGEASQLISLHYGASEDEFLFLLEARARSTDVLPISMPSSPDDINLTVNPYYDVLYAFHIERANYRAAAMVLYEHAHRLGEEIACSTFSLSADGFRASGARLLFGLQRQTACLVSAINVLYLVSEEHRWLIRPGSSILNGACPMVITRQDTIEERENQLDIENGLEALVEDEWAFEGPGEQVLKSEEIVGEPVIDRSRYDHITSDDSATFTNSRLTRGAQDKQILQLPDLIRLYTLARARLSLAQACWEQGMLRAGPATPEEMVQSLLTLALYDEAVRVAEQFDLSRVPIVDAVAIRCAELAQHTSANSTSTAFMKDIPPDFLLSTNNSIPPLSGLADISSHLTQEKELVIQSINNLTGSISICQPIANSRPEGNNAAIGLRSLALSELYWRLLEVVLSRLDPSTKIELKCPSKQTHISSHDGGYLLLVACQHLLSSGPSQLHLPGWLTSQLLCSTAQTSRPVGLLRLYLQYDRIEAAYNLVMDMLEAARGTGSDPFAFGLQASLDSGSKRNIGPHHSLIRKSRNQPVWIPHVLIVRLLQALHSLSTEFPACQTMYSNLSQNMVKYFECLSASCLKLAA